MSAPVKNTCPDIDRLIKLLQNIATTAKRGMDDNERYSDNYQLFKDCEWDIDDIIGSLENLRKANESLRQWGEGLDIEVQESADYIYVLEKENSELKAVAP
jgi:predicted nuclease with TOPRIM domain